MDTSACQEGTCTHALQDTKNCNITYNESDTDVSDTEHEPRPTCRVRIANVTPEIVDKDDYNLSGMPYVIVYGRRVKDFRAGKDRDKFMSEKFPRYKNALRDPIGHHLNSGNLPEIFNNLYDESSFVTLGVMNHLSSSEDSDVPAKVRMAL